MKRSYLSVGDLRKRGQDAKDKSQQGGTPIAINARGQIVGPALADHEIVIRSASYEIKAVDDKARTIEFVITTDDVDRENDIIAIEGWDTTDYEKNPVVLFGHDHYSLPVGRSQRLWRSGNAMHSICEFTPEDLNPFGYLCFRMYKERYLNATSVGFKPLEYTYDEERKWGINFYRQALLEYSCVPVPANPNALAIARSSGIDLTPLKAWAERIIDEARMQGLPDAVRLDYEAIYRASAERHKMLVDFYSGIKASEPKSTPPPADPRRKTVERWTCKTNHEHVTLAECEACDKAVEAEANFTNSVGIGVGWVKAMCDQIKEGRVLSAANETSIRTAAAALAEVLAQLDKTTNDDKEETDDDKAVEAAVRVMDEAVNKESDEAIAVSVIPSDDDDTQKGGDVDSVLMISEEALAGVVQQAVQDGINRITGRVD